MKEKVSLMAKGIFKYENPTIILSQPKLYIEAEAGKVKQGTIQISNSENTYMKGVLYSDSPNLQIKTKTFAGTTADIVIEYHAEEGMGQANYTGNITIVTSCGVIKLPYDVTIQSENVKSSIGKIRNLDTFTKLAKENWIEALELFKMPEFKKVLLKNQAEEGRLYEGLLEGTSTSQAMDEFLISIHKKELVTVTANETVFYYDNVMDGFAQKIILHKNTFGPIELKVESDAPFICPAQERVSNEQFIGDVCTLEVLVDYEKLRRGENKGHVLIKNIHQTIEIEFCAICPNKGRKVGLYHTKKNGYEIQLTKKYLEFRMSKINKKEYEEALETILHNLIAIDPDTRYTLWQAHLYMIAGREVELDNLMGNFSIQEHVLLEESVYNYLAYLYLKSLYTKEEKDIQYAIQTIQEYYGKEYPDWILLWFLLYLDHEYDEKKEYKLELLKAQYNKGVISPVLYYEAYMIYAKEPTLLQELGEYEIQVLHFAIRNDCISKELTEQFTFLVSRKRSFNSLLFKDLTVLYERYKLIDTLTAICKMLINGHKINNCYFTWYQLGVKEQLKITDLYECYMYSIPDEKEIELDPSILLYFIYNNTLSDLKKAYLYSYIIKNKEKQESIYRTYYKQMELFAKRQIMKRAMNKNLSIIYEEMIGGESVDFELSKALPAVMFRKQLICQVDGIVGVVVIHPELREEEFVPIMDHKAEINVYTNTAKIYLVDDNKNRYETTIPYQITQFLDFKRYLHQCYLHNKYDVYLQIHLAEQNSKDRVQEIDRFDIQNKLIHATQISKEYKKVLYMQMIEYQYQHGQQEKLEEYLLTLNLELIDNQNRHKIVEYLVMRELYNKAFDCVVIYGYEKVELELLLSLCTHVIQNMTHIADPQLLSAMCYWLFEHHIDNEVTLAYLAVHDEDTNEVLYQIWKRAKEVGVQVQLLEERLLGQMLFSEAMDHGAEVFCSYYTKGHNKILMKGFLNYSAYQYMVKGQKIQKEIIEAMKKVVMEENLILCKLTLLSYYSQHPTLEKELLHHLSMWIDEFVKKGIVLPFFQRYIGVLDIPCTIYDKYYIQYIANPTHEVTIHYEINGDGNLIDQQMNNVIEGIHVKEFILFQGETVEYYITEKNGEMNRRTETKLVKIDQSMRDKNNKFGLLNLMLSMEEKKEDENLIELMKCYATSEFLASSLYQPL